MGRQSGEYVLPVSQEAFNSFVGEFRGFVTRTDQRLESGDDRMRAMESTIAVISTKTDLFTKRSDEQSSKINLLAIKEANRATLETVKDANDKALEKAHERDTKWMRIVKEKALSVIVGLLTAGIATTIWGTYQWIMNQQAQKAQVQTIIEHVTPSSLAPNHGP